MLLLLFLCLSTGGESLPVNATQESHSDQARGNLLNAIRQATDFYQVIQTPFNTTFKTSGLSTGGGVPLNQTKNATSSISGVSLLNPPRKESPETQEELDDWIQEGDILVSEDRNAVSSIWDSAIVPYSITEELEDSEPKILSAFKMITDVTCIRFLKRTTEMDYINFLNGKGCASFVGKLGGPQPLYYGKSCQVGNLCHEVMHALGLHHEHTRFDRDQYVHVNWENIKQGKEKDFDIKRADTLNLPYDIDSIMHYGQFFFSKNKKATIEPFNNLPSKMGQRSMLTELDIQKLNRLYHCPAGLPFGPPGLPFGPEERLESPEGLDLPGS